MYGTFFKEYSISFLIIDRFTDFTFVVLCLLMFKVYEHIGISKIEFFNFSGTERFKKDKLQNWFDNAKSFVRYFTGTKTQDLHHYIIPSLFTEKPGIVAIHVSSNNITHIIFEDFNVNKVTGETINSGNPLD